MEEYLVVSYDDDQQQWFFDVVFADSGEAAVERICGEIRPYVIAADYLDANHLESLSRHFKAVTQEVSEADLAIAKGE